MFPKAYHTDLDLELPDLDGTRSLYVAIYDAEHPDRCEIQLDACQDQVWLPWILKCYTTCRWSEGKIQDGVNFRSTSYL